MRREGKVSGYIKGRRSKAALRKIEQELQDLGLCDLMQVRSDYWPRVKVTNKPTNESKDSGRCHRKGCRGCHLSPVSKALPKTKGHRRNKLSKSELMLLADPMWVLQTRGRATATAVVQRQVLIGNPHPYIDHACYMGHGYAGYGDSLDSDHPEGHYENDDDDGHDVDISTKFGNDQEVAHYANRDIRDDDHFDVSHGVIAHHVDFDVDSSAVVVCHDDAGLHDDGDLCIVGGRPLTQTIQMLGHSPLKFDEDGVADAVDLGWYHVIASDSEPNEDDWYFC